MNFNFIPTDNLYKFMSLSGLFLCILNVFYTGEELYKLQEERIRFLGEMKSFIRLAESHLQESHSLNEQIGKLGKFHQEYIDEFYKNQAVFDRYEEQLKNAKSRTEALQLIRKMDESVKIMEMIQSGNHPRLKENETEIERLRRQISELEKKDAENKIARESSEAKLQLNEELLEVKTRKYEYFKRLLFIGYFLGLVFIGYGFHGWIKIQTREDQLLFRRMTPVVRRYPRTFRRK